jgi:hypothetical protein
MVRASLLEAPVSPWESREDIPDVIPLISILNSLVLVFLIGETGPAFRPKPRVASM